MSSHLDPEDVALYAEQGPAAARAVEIAAHLRECEACLQEVVEARNLADLSQSASRMEPLRRSLSPRLARYLRSREPGSGPTPRGVGMGIAGLLGAGAGAAAAASFGGGMSLGDVRNESPPPSLGQEGGDMTEHGFTRPDPVIGTPLADSGSFPGQQSYTDTCAIRCQEFIIRQFTGAQVSEKALVDEARAHGWYRDGGGTDLRDVGKLLELHGVPVHRYVDANPWQLAAELARGHKVILGVDADELWRQHPVLTDIKHLFGLGAADHAVVVSGIDTSDPRHVQVIVSDPGTGEAAARYPMDQFLNAWKDSHFFMVATQQPPPIELHLPEMSHFDYQAGHLDRVGELSWDQFQDACQAHDHDALLPLLEPFPDPHSHHDDEVDDLPAPSWQHHDEPAGEHHADGDDFGSGPHHGTDDDGGHHHE